MALKTYYRAGRFIKGYLIKYLQSVFYAAEKEQIILTDGTKRIEFTDIDNKPTYGVWVGGSLSWTEQYIPAVLIREGSVQYKPLSFSKDLTDVTDDEVADGDQWKHYGGDIEVKLGLSARARTIVEKDNLVDIVCLYLSHPDAKDFFNQHDIVLPTPPSVGGESQISQPQSLDFPLYVSDISLTLTGQWDYRENVEGPRLNAIVASITTEFSYDES